MSRFAVCHVLPSAVRCFLITRVILYNCKVGKQADMETSTGVENADVSYSNDFDSLPFIGETDKVSPDNFPTVGDILFDEDEGENGGLDCSLGGSISSHSNQKTFSVKTLPSESSCNSDEFDGFPVEKAPAFATPAHHTDDFDSPLQSGILSNSPIQRDSVGTSQVQTPCAETSSSGALKGKDILNPQKIVGCESLDVTSYSENFDSPLSSRFSPFVPKEMVHISAPSETNPISTCATVPTSTVFEFSGLKAAHYIDGAALIKCFR